MDLGNEFRATASADCANNERTVGMNCEKGRDAIDVECPFCHEKDFDLVGLKDHLKYYCLTSQNGYGDSFFPT